MDLFDVESWRQAGEGVVAQLGATLGGFVPKLAATIALLVVGWALARLVEAVSRRILQRLGLDARGGRLRFGETLEQAGIRAAPSALLARAAFWVLLLGFLLVAVETLGITAVTGTVERLVSYLPNVVAGVLLLLLGLLGGRLIRNVVGSAAAAADFGQAARLGAAAQAVVVLLVGVLALEQLGVETEVLVSLLTTVVAAVAVAVGLCFALGARPVVTHILAGHFLRQSVAAGGSLEIEGRRGVVERVGPVDTLLRDDRGSWSIPNARLLETVLGR